MKLMLSIVVFPLLLGVAAHTRSLAAEVENNDVLPQAAWHVLVKRLPTLAENIDFHRGDLDSDGVPDVVAIARYTEGSREMYRIVLLKGSENGSYHWITVSSPFFLFQDQKIRVRIQDKSFQLITHRGLYATYEDATYLFQRRARRWMLVSFEFATSNYLRQPESSISADFLSNQVVEWPNEDGDPILVRRSLLGDNKLPFEEFALNGGASELSIGGIWCLSRRCWARSSTGLPWPRFKP
jgi:hypothetical protein